VASFVTEVFEIAGIGAERAVRRAANRQEQVVDKAKIRLLGTRAKAFTGIALVCRVLVSTALLSLGRVGGVIAGLAALLCITIFRRWVFELQRRHSRHARAMAVLSVALTLALVAVLAVRRPGMALVLAIGELIGWLGRKDLAEARRLAGKSFVVV